RAPTLERALAAAAGVFLMVLAIAASARPVMTAALLVGAAIAYLVLRGTATAMRFAARRAAQRARGLRRLALANLGGPGSLAPTTAPALGLGLALLTLVAAVQANLLRQISETAPRNAPSMVFSQIPNQETAQFDQILAESGVVLSDPENYRRAPVILGRVTRLKGEELVRDEIPPGERWVVDGEVTLTYLANKPPEATLTEGDWWTDDYDGPLLVSVEAAAAKGLDLTIGDTVGFQIFGRAIEARVASLRLVDWGGFGVNTAFILSPGALEAANPRHFAILKTPAEKETAIIAALGEALPDVVVFQTREALATAARMFADIGLAVNAAAGVVSLAGLLVLFGAFAAIARKRRVESALLKSFGATRGRVLGLYAGEFALAGSIAALLGVAMGLAAAYPVVVYVFEARWALPVEPIATIAAAAIAVAAIGGGLVGAALLSLRPAQILRSA
ncbi:MAG: FtsX-like permease family protein, partial [Pseudomonadota bacterium]